MVHLKVKHKIDILTLSHKNNQNLSKKFIFLFIIIVLLLILFIPAIFYHTYKGSVSEILNSDYDFRIIQVIGDKYIDKTKEILKDNKDIIRMIDSSEHEIMEGSLFLNFQNQTTTDTIIIKPSITSFMPSIVSGSDLQGEFDLVCPIKMAFGVFDDEDINTFINMEENINQGITLRFSRSYLDEFDNWQSIFHDYTFNLIGVYDAKDAYSYSTCYISEDTFNRINEEFQGELEKINYDKELKSRFLYLYVNKLENVSKVENILKENNIPYFISEMDLDFLYDALSISKILMILVIFISFIIILGYFKIYFKEKEKNIALYKILGFSKSDINQILFFSIMELFILAFVITCFVLIIGKYFLYFYLKNNVTYMSLVIRIPILPILIYIISILLFIYLVLIFQNKKIIKMPVIKIME